MILTSKHACTYRQFEPANASAPSVRFLTGARETSDDLLAFTDDDCVNPPDGIRSIVATFRAEPAAGMLCGQVLLPAALAESPKVVPTLPIERLRRLSPRDGFRI